MAHLTRYYMYKKIQEYFKQPMRGKILGISRIEIFYSLIDMQQCCGYKHAISGSGYVRLLYFIC